MTFDDHKVRLKTGTDAVLNDFTAAAVGFDNDGSAGELFGFIEDLAFFYEEAESAVRFFTDTENGNLFFRLAAEFQRGADVPVAVLSHEGAGVRMRQGAGRGAAVPEGDRVFLLVQGHGVAEKGGDAGQPTVIPCSS